MTTSITRVLKSMVLILAVTGSWPLLAASSQEGEERKETFTMVAISTKGAARVTIDFTMRINEFTTDQEALELIEILREGGTDQYIGACSACQVKFLGTGRTKSAIITIITDVVMLRRNHHILPNVSCFANSDRDSA